jgi:broad specificity phosphatase PhoE
VQEIQFEEPGPFRERRIQSPQLHGKARNNKLTTLYIVRHAEKEKGDFYNARLRHQDQPISQKGQKEAQKLCSFFADKNISKIYVSGYLRTSQTIAPLARQLSLAPIVDHRLNEIDNGCFDGQTEQEIQQKFPEIWAAYLDRKADFRFPEGETGEEAQGRIVDIIQQVRQLTGKDNIILVSHEGLMLLLMCYIMQLPVYKRWNFQVDPCGIMEITYQSDFQEWKLIRFNQICF